MTTDYDSMLLCPWGEQGEIALHEAIQDGWEPLIAFLCEENIQHIALRRIAEKEKEPS
jgi:hypothetical protein